MSAALALVPATDAPGRLSGVSAYVLDADSEAVLRRAAANLALPGFEVRQGDIRMAERDLRAKRSPAVLFVDVSDTDMVADAMARLSEVCEPQLQVVAIGRRNDIGLYRELLAMGVADYVFKPLTGSLIESMITRMTGGGTPSVAASRQGKLVVVSGARGGTGASSIAANVASYLADKGGRRVVLVDLDLRTGAQALMLGVQPNIGLAEALETPNRIDDLFVERATIKAGERLDLLASELPLERASAIAYATCDTLVARLRKAYFYVIVDLPRGMGAMEAALATTANLRLVVTEATLLGARDANRGVQAGIGQKIVLVHNKAGRPGDLSDKDFTATLERAPDLAVPFVPKAFGDGINLGRPAWQAGGAVEIAIAALARELSGQGGAPVKPPFSLGAWLRG